MEKNAREKIINVAVIAHVDHGKTTLVDALLKQSHVFRDNEQEMQQDQILDKNELERERGITILAKNCSIRYKDTKINIIDTQGHADFSGEVERTLGMADGALLIVDAQEGPMPQTRFVLRKAFELGLKIIVVINKIDKKFARPGITLHKVESLFLELAKNETELNFPVVYAIGRRGVAFDHIPFSLDQPGNIQPLLDKILETIPVAAFKNGPFKMTVTTLDYESHLGRIVIGRIHQGIIQKGMKVLNLSLPGKYWTAEKIMVNAGIKKIEKEEVACGDIVSIFGIEKAKIGDTISDPSNLTPLEGITISEPTLSITIGPNTSPFAGREGKFVTVTAIEDRLMRELDHNLSLKMKKLENGRFSVSGRGELHLSILLETMRREGYEMEIGKPEVITKDINGEKMEPVEEVSVIVSKTYVGIINEEFGKRYAKFIAMQPINQEEVEFLYQMPTRSLIGLRSYLLTATKGNIVITSASIGYEKLSQSLPKLRRGALIASESGVSLAYGLENAQGRGITFIDPGTKVYEGMIIGVNAKEEDIAINICKGKKLTNMRSKASDGVIQLTPPTKFSLEQSMNFLENDELLEITPMSLRLRKKQLTDLERRRVSRTARHATAIIENDISHE